MRTARWRAGLAFSVAALVLLLLVACGDDDTGTAGITPPRDSGAMDSGRSDAGR